MQLSEFIVEKNRIETTVVFATNFNCTIALLDFLKMQSLTKS
jgi:hypothetical protein